MRFMSRSVSGALRQQNVRTHENVANYAVRPRVGVRRKGMRTKRDVSCRFYQAKTQYCSYKIDTTKELID